MVYDLFDENANQAHNNVDDEESCLVPPDAAGQGEYLDKGPAHLHTSNPVHRIILALPCSQGGCTGWK